MVISYKNKFLKVFLSSLALFILIIIFLISVYNLTTNESVKEIPDYILFISKVLPILVIVAYGLYIWSHYLLAKAKGYSGWFTLLALINTIGLAIIFLLPDKRKNG